MNRLIWILGEVIVGALISGAVGALVVPIAMRAGWDTGPWSLGVLLAASIVVSVVAGERLRKRRGRPRPA